ncbi:MAG: energy transducer TonB [Bryobacteraceae bacterium]
MGLVVQAGLVTGMLLVPMVSPEILGVMLPKAMIYVPVKQVAPVEVEVQTASSSRTNVPNTVVAVRPAYRPFTAPRAYNNPIASIIDGNDYNPPAFTIGAPVNFANSAPFAGTGSALPSAPPPKLAPTVRKDPVRVGGDVQAANILSRVKPVYPPLAKQARISGSVKLEGVIAKDGTVQRLKVISGHPFLVPAAVEAVKQWRYRPTHLNGEPVEVLAPIDVNFILSN